jgi:hypothetical protein
VPSPSSVDFALAVRAIGRELRRRGLAVPSFRSPPRLAGVNRSLRRHANGVTVAVQLRDRPWVAVLGDLIEGAVVANRLPAAQADALRSHLWTVLGEQPQPTRRVA